MRGFRRRGRREGGGTRGGRGEGGRVVEGVLVMLRGGRFARRRMGWYVGLEMTSVFAVFGSRARDKMAGMDAAHRLVAVFQGG